MLRGVWFQSDGRGVWGSVDPGRLPPKRGDPEGRNVWDFTYSHETAGSDVWLKPVPSLFSGQACPPQTGNPKKRAWWHVTQEEGSTILGPQKMSQRQSLEDLYLEIFRNSQGSKAVYFSLVSTFEVQAVQI